jgi:phage gpG-like protein
MDLQQFKAKIDKWNTELKRSVFPAMEKEIGKSILEHFINNFKAGGYEKGNSFIPWAKRKYSYNHKPLQKTGKLLDGFRLEQKGNQIEIVNDVPYAKYINNGTNDMAERPLLYESDKIEKEIEDIITKQLMALFK